MTDLALATLAYLAGLALSVVLAVGAGGAAAPSLAAIATCLVPIAVPVALTMVRRPELAGAVWPLFWAVLTATVLVLAATARLPTAPYGDGVIFAQFVEKGMVVPRWLAGSALAAWGFAAAWEFPPLMARLPESLSSATGYLSVLCPMATGLGTVALLRRWPTSLAVLFPTLTPVWLLFASGYVEYYPLIAPLFVAVLAWLFEKPLEGRPPVQLGVVAGLLPFIYAGFAPVSVMLLVAYGVSRRTHLLQTLGAAGLTAVLTITVCWPQGVSSFFRSLYSVMNFGNGGLPERYAGMAASEVSIFFAPRVLLTSEHLTDIVYMAFWGGGWWSVPLLVGAIVVPRASGAALSLLADVRLWLGVALLVWQALYLSLMIPRLGPTDDIDLFFSAYLTMAFFAGLLCDQFAWAAGGRRRHALVAGVFGASVGIALYLAWLGIPVKA